MMESSRNFNGKSLSVSILSLLGLSLMGLVVSSIFTSSILGFDGKGDGVSGLMLMAVNGISIILAMGLPAYLFARIFSVNAISSLYLDRVPSKQHIVISILLFIVSAPLISAIGTFNASLELPESFAWIQEFIELMEATVLDMMSTMLAGDGVIDIICGVLFIAVVPAIFEELLFRGALLRLLKQYISVDIAIVISAFVFSAIHLQFLGFLPRFALGLILGYLAVWSGSLWLPILFHFINNATALFFIYRDGIESIDVASTESGYFQNGYMLLVAALFGYVLLRKLYLTKVDARDQV